MTTAWAAPAAARCLGARFLVFGLIVVIVVGLLRPAVLPAGRDRAATTPALAEEAPARRSRSRSARGLIYDRKGRPLAITCPLTCPHPPADLPFSQRDAVVARLSSLLDVPAARDLRGARPVRQPALRARPRRRGRPADVARIIAEESRDLPGVEVDVEERREYPYGPLVSHVLGCTGAVTAEDLLELERRGYLHDDDIGKTGVEATSRTSCAARTARAGRARRGAAASFARSRSIDEPEAATRSS